MKKTGNVVAWKSTPDFAKGDKEGTSSTATPDEASEGVKRTVTFTDSVEAKVPKMKTEEVEEEHECVAIAKAADEYFSQLERESAISSITVGPMVVDTVTVTSDSIVIASEIELLLRDNVIILVLSVVTTIITYLRWEDVTKNQVPFQVAAGWLVLTFLVGYVVAQTRLELEYKEEREQLKKLQQEQKKAALLPRSSQSTSASEDSHVAFEHRHSFLLSAMSIVARKKIVTLPKVSVEEEVILPEGFFTCLREKVTEPEICPFLLKRLLIPASNTKTPDGKGIIPICKFRGMDILLTDSPEDPIYKNKLLNK